ncbi:MAG TPA: YceI family protein [Methylophilaceae bacterium]
MKKLLFGLVLAGFTSIAVAQNIQTYGIDNTHSFANFTIRHVVSKTSGTFPDVTGLITIDQDNLSNSSVKASINILSVSTNNAKRDEHITTKPEYLDAGKFAKMTFESTSVEASSKTEGVLHGNFTLHGVTKQISFPFKILGVGSDPWGGTRMGIEAHTSIKASDYGLNWGVEPNAPIGNDIDITLLIEGAKSSPDHKPF